jgi:hypothetical protein
MLTKPSKLILQILGPNIDTLYMRLQLSMLRIIALVEDENRIKGYYNPKRDTILECENVSAFKEFQSLIKGLNNYVYFNSLILSGYSIFEHSLKSICLFISEHFGNYKTFDDEPRDVLGNCIKYLKGTDLINFKDNEIDKYYIQIKNVNKLRNLIAHFNGNLYRDKTKPLKDQKHYNLFCSDKRLIIVQNGQIYIDDSDYIISFIQNSEKFLQRIVEEIKK